MHLIVRELEVLRGSRSVLAGVSFDVAGGDALLLTGRNGSGKTTLIRTLAGFIRPQAGLVRLEGGDPEQSLGEQCHYVGHLNGTKASLSVAANLRFWADYLGEGSATAREERVAEALARFGLEALADIPVAYLSAGQRRRAGLARLLVAERPIWLLDEPTVTLDAASTALLAELIGAHVAGGGIVIAATHIPLGIAGARYLPLGAEVTA